MMSYIGLGSNLEHPPKQLAMAIALLQKIQNTKLIKASSIYITAPVGVTDQSDFYNQVIMLDTALSAHDLLHALQVIEQTMGRVRTMHWGPRVIDCDILLYGNVCIESDSLVVPHPHMTTRAFVLYPLVEISPDLVLPSGQNVQQLCRIVADQKIRKQEKTNE